MLNLIRINPFSIIKTSLSLIKRQSIHSQTLKPIMPAMQQDPAFVKLYQKSFILQKYDDIEIPIIKKQPTIKNHAFTTFLLASVTHFLIYPFDTIKTRLIASNKVIDIANFTLNKTKSQTAYMGLFRGYFSVMVGNAIFLTIGKEDFVKGAVLEGILKTWIDMMKISKQMANKSADLTIMRQSFGWATISAILRDLTYRGSFILIFQKLNQKFLEGGKFDNDIKINNMFISVIGSTILSQPLEVCFVKTASQRQMKYRDFIRTGIEVAKEEGMGKLCTSGLWPRIMYNLISTSIMFHLYDQVLESSLEAI